MDEIVGYLPIISTLATGLMAWLLWSVRRGLVTREEMESSLAKADERLKQMEIRVGALPDRESLDRLCRRLDDLHGGQREMVGRMDVISGQMRLLIEHHLE